MKKISIAVAQKIEKVEGQRLTVGLDLGDRSSCIHALIRRCVRCCSAPSLRVNPMPSRITQKSCRPRVSHRIVVGRGSRAVSIWKSTVQQLRSALLHPGLRSSRRIRNSALPAPGDTAEKFRTPWLGVCRRAIPRN